LFGKERIMPVHTSKNNKNRVIIAVTNDLVSDNRVNKVALTLLKIGFDVTLAGRKLPNSLPILNRKYKTQRFHLPFRNGPLFYASYNIRLFFYLLLQKVDVIVSNDLDTLAACYLAAKLKKKKLVYDSHEYFTQVPELIGRPRIQNIWEVIERNIVPKLENCITVCKSIADIYTEKYGVPFHVVRNIPAKRVISPPTINGTIPIPTDLPIILYQGAVNIGRGIEEAILSMHAMDNARLVIIGDGDLWKECNELVIREKLTSKVILTGRIPMEKLPQITPKATIGLSVEKDMGLNYRYALPNKLFDYIHAGVPVLSSSLPEIRLIMDTYEIGMTIEEVTPKNIAHALKFMLANNEMLETWKSNCVKASEDLCWEKEEKVLMGIYTPLLKKNSPRKMQGHT
jgi:glycosyltransferase involved in cell wall biosynthesis